MQRGALPPAVPPDLERGALPPAVPPTAEATGGAAPRGPPDGRGRIPQLRPHRFHPSRADEDPGTLRPRSADRRPSLAVRGPSSSRGDGREGRRGRTADPLRSPPRRVPPRPPRADGGALPRRPLRRAGAPRRLRAAPGPRPRGPGGPPGE